MPPCHKAHGIHDFILATKSPIWIIITIYHYPYRAFGGQNKIVYSTRFVTRREIILLLPG